MNATDIFSKARELTNTSESMTNVNDASLLPYLNEIYHDMEDTIVTSLGEDVFFAEFKTDLVADQGEYQWKQGSSTEYGFKTIKELAVKWDAETDDFKVLPMVESDNVYGADDVQFRDTPQSNGYYDVQGEYIYIFPAPDTTVTDGLYVKVATNLVDLTTTTVEADIFPGHGEFRQFHMGLALGLCQYIYRLKGELDLAGFAKADYNQYKLDMTIKLKNRLKTQPNWTGRQSSDYNLMR